MIECFYWRGEHTCKINKRSVSLAILNLFASVLANIIYMTNNMNGFWNHFIISIQIGNANHINYIETIKLMEGKRDSTKLFYFLHFHNILKLYESEPILTKKTQFNNLFKNF